MPSCGRFSVYLPNFVLHLSFSNLVDHLSFLGHVVLVEEPLEVTNILDSGGIGSNPAVTISYLFLHFHFFIRFLFFCDHFKVMQKVKMGLFANTFLKIFLKSILNFPSPRVELRPRDLKAKLYPTLPWRLVQISSFKLRIYTTIYKLVTAVGSSTNTT
jgi:hypothetical protein